MKGTSKNNQIRFLLDDLMMVNKMHIPALEAPIHIRIYWFQARNKNTSFFAQPHQHTFFESHFILNGKTIYDIDSEEVVVEQGQFILIPSNTIHTQKYCSEDLVKLSLSFDIIANENNHLSQIMAKDFARASFICDDCTGEMILTIELISKLVKRMETLASLTVKNHIFTLISELYYAVTRRQYVVSSPSNRDSTDTRYISAKKFIDDNVFIKLSAPDIATHVHLSAKQLNRIFLKYEKMSVADYISEKKHSAAKELLISTDLSLQRISEKLGFADEFYFNKWFTKKAGITPRKFRIINGTVIKEKNFKGETN